VPILRTPPRMCEVTWMPDKTLDDMESKFDKKFDKDLICGYVNGKIKKEWYLLYEYMF